MLLSSLRRCSGPVARIACIKPAGTVRSYQSTSERFWKWTTQERPFWMKDWKEGTIACIIFAITGSSSMMLVRPMVEKVFNLKGSMIEGPNSYRVISLLAVSPIYAMMLTLIGTLGGRHRFFAGMAMKIVRRFIPCSFSQRIVCQPARVKMASFNNCGLALSAYSMPVR